MQNPTAPSLTQQQITQLYQSMQQPTYFPTQETNEMYKLLIKYQLTETELTQTQLKLLMSNFQKSIPYEEAEVLMRNLILFKNNIKVIKKYIENKNNRVGQNLFLLFFCQITHTIVTVVKKGIKTLNQHNPSQKKMSQKQIFILLQKYLLKKQNKHIFDKVCGQINQFIKEKHQTQKLLKRFDLDGDGFLDKGQLYNFMNCMMVNAGRSSPTRDQFQQLWGKIQKTNKDKITVMQLLQFKKSFKSNHTTQKKLTQQIQSHKEIQVILNGYNSQGKPYLTNEQSKKFIRQVILRGQSKVNQDLIEKILKKIDKDGNGMIGINQLLQLKQNHLKIKQRQRSKQKTIK